MDYPGACQLVSSLPDKLFWHPVQPGIALTPNAVLTCKPAGADVQAKFSEQAPPNLHFILRRAIST